jgi:hypothetical protein
VSAGIQVEGGGEHPSHDQRVEQDPQRHRTRSRRTPPPAINTQNRACLSISSFFDHMHNSSDQNGVATTD